MERVGRWKTELSYSNSPQCTRHRGRSRIWTRAPSSGLSIEHWPAQRWCCAHQAMVDSPSPEVIDHMSKVKIVRNETWQARSSIHGHVRSRIIFYTTPAFRPGNFTSKNRLLWCVIFGRFQRQQINIVYTIPVSRCLEPLLKLLTRHHKVLIILGKQLKIVYVAYIGEWSTYDNQFVDVI